MRADRTFTLKLLLRRRSCKKLRSSSNEAYRRDLHRASLLWLSKNYRGVAKGGVSSESETHSEGHAISRTCWTTARPAHIKAAPRAQGLSVPVKREKDYPAVRGLEHRYHLYSTAKRVCISCRSHGLVQSACVILSAVKQLGDRVLLRGSQRSFRNVWTPRDFQYRSGRTIHFQRIYRCGHRQWDAFQHGWKRASPRQYFCGAPLEVF